MKTYENYMVKIIGGLLIASSFIGAFFILNDRFIFLPEGGIIESYLLSRNLLIIFILNWIFFTWFKINKKIEQYFALFFIDI